MSTTLYAILEEIDKIKNRGAYKNTNISYQELKKSIISIYSENRILDQAIKGIKSIEETVEELDKEFMGYKRFIPHRKDEEHNKKVVELSELIPSYILKKEFKFNPFTTDPIKFNLINAGVFFGGIGLLEGGLISILIQPDSFLLLGLPALLSSVGMSLSSISVYEHYENAKKAKEEARCLDSKIKELI